MELHIIMVIIWSVVIALAMIIEFLSYDMVTGFFVPSGLVVLIMAACDVVYWAQIIVFIGLSVVLTLVFRPILKRALVKPTIPTNITDVNIGRKLKLTADTVDGASTIEVNGVTWSARLQGDEDLKKGTLVEIIESKSNTFVVKKAETKAKEKKEGEE